MLQQAAASDDVLGGGGEVTSTGQPERSDGEVACWLNYGDSFR